MFDLMLVNGYFIKAKRGILPGLGYSNCNDNFSDNASKVKYLQNS
jgi:hypothetical protein